jgi:hypothetical protein
MSVTEKWCGVMSPMSQIKWHMDVPFNLVFSGFGSVEQYFAFGEGFTHTNQAH